jgi:DNA-binding response OmpR family regulator
MHILIVEDHGDSAAILSKLLVKHGHTSEIAPSVALGIAAAAITQFDVALVDLTLPDGRGEDLAPFFQEKQIKCIALSGAHPDSIKAGIPGFVACLTKPINFADLAVILNDVK